MLVRDIAVLETVARSAPLGVQFWDSVDARTVSNGLVLVTFAPDEPRRRLLASATPHDVFLIGMMLVVEVRDLYGRFLPFTWTPPMASPLQPAHSLHRLPLFSAPSRLLPAGVGVVRAELHEPDGTPAASAVLEVTPPGQAPLRGMADDQGRVVVVVPYPPPEPEPLANASPLAPLAAGGKRAAQTWRLLVRAAYQPLRPAPTLPDIDVALAQPPAILWADIARSAALTTLELQFGRGTLLASVDTTGLTRPSELLIQPVS